MTVRIKYGELWNTLLKIEWDKRAQKQWDPVQGAIEEEGNNQCTPKKARRKIKPWMIEHILQLMEERRKWKDWDREVLVEE